MWYAAFYALLIWDLLIADSACEVVFFRTVAPVEPVSFVQRICEDAVNKKLRRRTKTVKRLSPMSLMGRASAEGLESVAKQVLAPHFHKQPFESRKVS